MGIEVADGAVHLAENFDIAKQRGLTLDPGDKVRNFLAQGRRRGRLSMRTREHRQVGETARELTQIRCERCQRGCQHRLAGVAQHLRVGQVVNVFGGAGEMQECRQ
jgi:hypothetical protein